MSLSYVVIFFFYETVDAFAAIGKTAFSHVAWARTETFALNFAELVFKNKIVSFYHKIRKMALFFLYFDKLKLNFLDNFLFFVIVELSEFIFNQSHRG